MRVKPNWVITILLTVIYMAIVGAVWAINDVDYNTVGDTTDNIVAGIIVNLQIYFRPTSLYNTLIMLALLAGGLGLIARSLRAAHSR